MAPPAGGQPYFLGPRSAWFVGERKGSLTCTKRGNFCHDLELGAEAEHRAVATACTSVQVSICPAAKGQCVAPFCTPQPLLMLSKSNGSVQRWCTGTRHASACDACEVEAQNRSARAGEKAGCSGQPLSSCLA